jgi:hypothetical protein
MATHALGPTGTMRSDAVGAGSMSKIQGSSGGGWWALPNAICWRRRNWILRDPDRTLRVSAELATPEEHLPVGDTFLLSRQSAPDSMMSLRFNNPTRGRCETLHVPGPRHLALPSRILRSERPYEPHDHHGRNQETERTGSIRKNNSDTEKQPEGVIVANHNFDWIR